MAVEPLGLGQGGGELDERAAVRTMGFGGVRQPVQGSKLAERQQRVFGVQEQAAVGHAVTFGREVGNDDHLFATAGAVRRGVRVDEPREQRVRGRRVAGPPGQFGQQPGVEHVLVVELLVHVHHGRQHRVGVLELDHDATAVLGRGRAASSQPHRAEHDLGRELIRGGRTARVVRAERLVLDVRPERPFGSGPGEHHVLQVRQTVHRGEKQNRQYINLYH